MDKCDESPFLDKVCPFQAQNQSRLDRVYGAVKWVDMILGKVCEFDGEPHTISTVEKCKMTWLCENGNPTQPIHFDRSQRIFFKKQAKILSRWKKNKRQGVHFYVTAQELLFGRVVLTHLLWDDWYFLVRPPARNEQDLINLGLFCDSFLDIPRGPLFVIK